jgi:hypothetical protein
VQGVRTSNTFALYKISKLISLLPPNGEEEESRDGEEVHTCCFALVKGMVVSRLPCVIKSGVRLFLGACVCVLASSTTASSIIHEEIAAKKHNVKAVLKILILIKI